MTVSSWRLLAEGLPCRERKHVMQIRARVSELAQRERFIRKLISTDTLYFVAGSDGWATVPFRHDRGREVVLFWTCRREAEKWGEVVVENPMVHDVRLGQLLAEVLPMLDANGCLIGHDWSSDPSDPVISPGELSERIWRDRNDHFIASMRATDTLWVLESASGPALIPSARSAEKDCLPVWATREAAATHIAGSWSNKRPLGIPLQTFRDRYLPFVESRGGMIGIEPLPQAGARELTAAEFTRLAFPAMALSQIRAVG